MNKNTLRAFKNIIDNPTATVNPARISSNRINNVGDALEGFIKDAYSELLGLGLSQEVKDLRYSDVFSWLGNPSNPPDAFLRGGDDGDSIEVKKIESLRSSIALNSSHPKNKLHSDDSRITITARNVEKWKIRDIVYAIGSVKNNELKRLWLIYGDCYAASRETYERLTKIIEDGVNEIPGVEFLKTNELAKIKKVDPLGITDMRVRGMWNIQNPSCLYPHLVSISEKRQYYLLMREEKYLSFKEEDRKLLEDLKLTGFSNKVIEIRNPDNPAQLLKARFIKYEI